MKGIIIYGNPLWGDNAGATYCDFINEAAFELKQNDSRMIISSLEGEASKSSKAVCSKDDTYDFETGALIALMKMCGLEKSAKAYAEIFDDTAYGDALIERDKLKEKVKDLHNFNERLIDEIDQKNHEIISLKALKLTNESLKKDNESFRKTCEKLKEENSNLKTQISVMAEKETELIDSNKRLSNKSETLTGALNTWKQRYRDLNNKNGELVVENYKLKTDCEKLQHGYIDTDMIFCGGRQNGKQYTFLVDLFKKIDQKKVDAAYKEAYNTELPVWQKEALKQIYDIHKESKEKTELPRTLDINGTVYRKTIQIKDFGEEITKLTVDSLIEESRAFTRKCIDEWLYKIPTKREEMWGKILGDHKYGESLGVKVERAFINDFLSEAEDNGVVWANGGEKPTEWDKWESWRRHDYIVFRVWYRGKTKELTWGYPSDEKTINYLPPMRWDLFKKGRLTVKVNYDNYKEFYEACEKELGKKPMTVYTGDYTVSICKKDGLFEVFTMEHQKKTGKKIVDWEDVR